MATTQKFGKYELVERIAVGGMAEIYRAKSSGAAGFEKELVIKRILPQFSADDDFVRMFIDEARLAAKLQHANIVQIFDFDSAELTDGASYYIAMELVEGKDVRHLLKEGIRRSVSLTVPMCLHIAIEALKGLHYAHAKADGGKPLNIVHRDVSPHNVLVSYSGEVKISDFGIAKAAARASATSNGMVKGKLAYMSPEQVTGQPLDRRTDIYSMGIVLYEMLTRTRLFAGQTDAEVITKVRDAVVPPPRQRNPQIPQDVEQVVLKMLTHDVRSRFQSGADAARALSQCASYSANEAAPVGEMVAQLFPPQQRPASAPQPAAAPARKPAPAPAAAPANEMATMMADAPSPEAIAAAAKANQKPAPAAAPAAKPGAAAPEMATMMADAGSPQHSAVAAQVAAAVAAAQASKAGAPPPAAAAKPAPSIMDQSTAILDSSSPQHAQIQAQIAAAAAKGAPPPAAGGGGKPPQSLMEQSTAILDSSSPQHAQIQAQIAAAAGRGAPPPAGGPPPSARGAPPPAASGPPPSAGGNPQRTVMLDANFPMPAPVPQRASGATSLPPMQMKAPPKQSTWGRWVLGPGIMSVTAVLVWFLAGFILPAASVKAADKPPVKERPMGRIQLKTTPPGATVKVDDKVLKHFTPTAVEGPIDETVHLLITLSGYKNHEEDVIFHKDERPLSIILDKIDEAAFEVKKRPKVEKVEKPTGKGTISIFVHPWAIVFVDDVRLRQTPIANFELTPGKHVFKLVNEGLGKTENVAVTIKSGPNSEIRREWAK